MCVLYISKSKPYCGIIYYFAKAKQYHNGSIGTVRGASPGILQGKPKTNGQKVVAMVMYYVHGCVSCYSIYQTIPYRKKEKTFKKESDVGMLLTGKQSTETSCM